MHFQRAPHAEAKLISCLRGEVFDVAVGFTHFPALVRQAIVGRQSTQYVHPARLRSWLPGHGR
jgi:hypothetical protein